MKLEKARFAAGCFWGVEEEFRVLEGVLRTRVGYSGGSFENPSYRDVCSGKTGHAETVEVEFDSDVISYDELLDVFWKIHDPTTLDRQGLDVGSQYRSVIFYFDEAQKNVALNSLEKEQKKRRGKIVTEIVEALEFYEAEEYHQKYLMKKGIASCRI